MCAILANDIRLSQTPRKTVYTTALVAAVIRVTALHHSAHDEGAVIVVVAVTLLPALHTHAHFKGCTTHKQHTQLLRCCYEQCERRCLTHGCLNSTMKTVNMRCSLYRNVSASHID
jgi:hypothetical protein